MTDWLIRAALPGDADAVADVWLAARRASVPSIPPPVHTEPEVRSWVRDVLLPLRELWVVEVRSHVVAMLALDELWVDQLFVLPEYGGQGIGTGLLDLAKALRPGGFGLWVFESNLGARRFYERHGLVEVARTDGSENEEGAPDIHYAWSPSLE
jgi:GNAT superfamily N-acetyltransferase